MKLINGLPCIAATLLISFDSARACTCMAPASPAEALRKLQLLFTGKVTKIYQSLWDAAGITRTGNHRVKFEVTKRWKGPRQEALWSSPDLAGKRVGFRSKRRRSIWCTWPLAHQISRQVFARGQRVLLALNRKWRQLDRLVKKSSSETLAGGGCPAVGQGITVQQRRGRGSHVPKYQDAFQF